MTRKKYYNAPPENGHGLLGVLRWQMGLGPHEVTPFPPGSLPPLPDFISPAAWKDLPAPDPDTIQLTWIGHSTFLIHHAGRTFLTDPVFGDIGLTLPLARLRRLQPPGRPLESLPRIDDVLISHSHYDHLDWATVKRLGNGPQYWLPAGLGRWFAKRGIGNTHELDWWQSAAVSPGIEIHSVPAQHFSARGPFDRNRSHWGGWVLRSEHRCIYFAGDTGYCDTFREIGDRFGGLDLAMIPIGAYRPRWLMKPVHVDPGEAVQIHLDVRARKSVACHWGTFALTDEPLNEPPNLLRAELARKELPLDSFRALTIGETVGV